MAASYWGRDAQIDTMHKRLALPQGKPVSDNIDECETSPYLPENCEHRLIGVYMVHAMSRWNEIVQHKPMNKIFDKGPHDDAPDEKLRADKTPCGEIDSRATTSKDAMNISPK